MKPSILVKTCLGVALSAMAGAAPISPSATALLAASTPNPPLVSSTAAAGNDSQVSAEWSYFMYWDKADWHYHNEKQDFECETYSSLFYPYTGYRLLRKYELTLALFPVKTSLKFVFCHRGRVVAQQVVEPAADSDRPLFGWDRKFCIASREPFTPDARGCFRLARRARYTDYALPLYAREAFVGGLFRCPSDDPAAPCDDNAAVSPAAPLLADEPYAGIFELHNPWKFLYHEPLFYTPDYYSQVYPRYSERWARFIDINEEYDADTLVVSKNGVKQRVARSKKYTGSSRPAAAAAAAGAVDAEDIFEVARRMAEPYLPRAIWDALFYVLRAPAAQETASARLLARVMAALGAMPDRRAAARIYHALVVRANGSGAAPDSRVRVVSGDGGKQPEAGEGLFGEPSSTGHNASEYAARYNNRDGLLGRLNVFEYYRPRSAKKAGAPPCRP